jgi:hypothetical protein
MKKKKKNKQDLIDRLGERERAQPEQSKAIKKAIKKVKRS